MPCLRTTFLSVLLPQSPYLGPERSTDLLHGLGQWLLPLWASLSGRKVGPPSTASHSPQDSGPYAPGSGPSSGPVFHPGLAVVVSHLVQMDHRHLQ